MAISTQQNADRIRRQIEQLRKFNKPFELAVRTIEAEKVVRIFQRGKNTAGLSFSYNSSNPLYVAQNQAPRAVNHTGKTGNTIRSGFYASYQAFRADQGRESGHVNYRLTNDLQSDYANANVSIQSDQLATPNPIQVTPFQYKMSLRRPGNAGKLRGLEKKYGAIFDANKSELLLFGKVLSFELAKLARL